MKQSSNNFNHLNKYLGYQNINWSGFNPANNLSRFPLISNIFKIISFPVALVISAVARLAGVQNNTVNKIVVLPESNKEKASFILSHPNLYSEKARENLMHNMEKITERNNKTIDKQIDKNPFYAYKCIDNDTKQPYYIYPFKDNELPKDAKGNLKFPQEELNNRANWMKSLLEKIDTKNINEKKLHQLNNILANAIDSNIIDKYAHAIPLKNGNLVLIHSNTHEPTIRLYNSDNKLVDICSAKDAEKRICDNIKNINSLKPYEDVTNLSIDEYRKLSSDEKALLPNEYTRTMDVISSIAKDDILPQYKILANIASVMTNENKRLNSASELDYLQNQTIHFPNNATHFEIRINDKNQPAFFLYDKNEQLIASSEKYASKELMTKFHEYDTKKNKSHSKEHNNEHNRDFNHNKSKSRDYNKDINKDLNKDLNKDNAQAKDNNIDTGKNNTPDHKVHINENTLTANEEINSEEKSNHNTADNKVSGSKENEPQKNDIKPLIELISACKSASKEENANIKETDKLNLIEEKVSVNSAKSIGELISANRVTVDKQEHNNTKEDHDISR